jgi:hypothetical protein
MNVGRWVPAVQTKSCNGVRWAMALWKQYSIRMLRNCGVVDYLFPEYQLQICVALGSELRSLG